VPTALDIPTDLIDLQRAVITTRQELNTYVTGVETERRALFPDPQQIVERRTWPAEQSAVLAELRATVDTAMRAVRHHPVMTQALAERCWRQTDEALQAAAKG
jgi:hypothetical protein